MDGLPCCDVRLLLQCEFVGRRHLLFLTQLDKSHRLPLETAGEFPKVSVPKTLKIV
jgi:hypothetical protein